MLGDAIHVTTSASIFALLAHTYPLNIKRHIKTELDLWPQCHIYILNWIYT